MQISHQKQKTKTKNSENISQSSNMTYELWYQIAYKYTEYLTELKYTQDISASHDVWK